MRGDRRRVGGRARIALVAALAVIVVPDAGAGWTDAAWRDDEHGRVTAGAGGSGTVAPPRSPTCLQSGLLVPPRVGWTAPTTGNPAGGYRWTVTVLTGVGSGAQGTLPGTATSWSDPGGLLNVVGTWKLTIQAVNATGWTSTAVTATVGETSVAGLNLSSTCSIP